MPRSARRPLEFPQFALRLVLVATAAVALIFQPAQSDTWWQLRAGEDIWRDHRIALVDQWSWSVAGDYWPDHEWLWQVIVYGLHSLGGMPLLAAANGAVAFGAVAISLPRHSPRRLDAVLVLLSVPLLASLWSLRPQVTSLFLFAVVLVLLRTERWWWIPPTMLVWANLHGAVVMGGLALAAAAAVSVLSWLRARTPEAARRCRRVVAATALSAVATLLTPLGYRLWTYVLTSRGRYRQDEIQEWKPATDLTALSVAFWLWVALVVVAVWLGRKRLRGWPVSSGMAVLVAVTPLAVAQVRNIPFFLLAALPLVATLLRREVPDAPGTGDQVPHGRTLVAAATLVAGLAVVATWVSPPERLAWTPIADAAIRAVEDCPEPLYNTYEAGGYLIWFAPDVKVFVDNRQDPYTSQVMELSTLPSPLDHRAAFDQWGVRCAFVERGSSTEQVLQGEGWATAYEDGSWTVLRR